MPSGSALMLHQWPYASQASSIWVALISTFVTCSFQQKAALNEHSLGRSIRVKNRAGACVSSHNISAASLHALKISSIAPQQWDNFTTASSGVLKS